MTETDTAWRMVPTPTIPNFRDYGGYALSGGGRLKTGWLFRSTQHLDADADDLAAVSGIGLRAVIDLRGGKERAASPCPRPDGFDARVYAVSEETGGLLAPHLAAANDVADGLSARDVMLSGYATMPFRWRMRGVLKNYFTALSETDGPSLVHCMAGKDRTGLACALLHVAMGVHRDDVVADYLLTNAQPDMEQRIADNAQKVRDMFGKTLAEHDIRLIMLCMPEYIEAALEAIVERHGTIPAYLDEHLGIDRAMLDAVAARVVA